MDQPYPTPPSFHPYALPPHHSSIPLHQQAVPAHTVSQQRQQEQSQENISPQSHPSAHPNHFHNGIPSEEQRAAVLILQAIPDPIFFDLLESFRSFFRGETALYPNKLSNQQRQAFLALQFCSDQLILTLRCFSGPYRYIILFIECRLTADIGSLASSQKFNDSSTLGNGRVAANSSTQSPSLVSNASTRDSLDSPPVQGSYNPSRDNSVALSNSSAASSNEHDRWCFICKNPTPCRTADGLKRHVREHFTRHYCIPQDPLVYKEDEPRCAFCDIPNPDPIHLNTHVTECVGKSYRRKSVLINHLETKHGVHDGSVLAGHFEYSVDLKYFPCGFCVFCCSSLIKLVNHVDAHHYKFSQHIRDWDNEKVIRGLLSQPDVIEYWQAILASNPPLQEPWLRLMPTLVEQLKRRLEMNGEHETLCNAAIDAGEYPRNRYGYLEPVSADQGMVSNQMIEPSEREVPISPLSFNSEQSHIAYAPHTTAAFPQLQHPAMGCDRLNHTDWDEGRPYSQIASNTYESPASATYQHPSHRAHIFYPSKCENFMQYRYPAYSSSTASPSGTSRVFEGQARDLYHPRLGGHSSGLSPNHFINAQSGHEEETYTTPAQAPAGWNYPASTLEAASSALSRDQNVSPQSHFINTYSPIVHPPLASHSSRREPTHRRVIVVDSDSANQQRFTQARGRSRR